MSNPSKRVRRIVYVCARCGTILEGEEGQPLHTLKGIPSKCLYHGGVWDTHSFQPVMVKE